jgi:hypothetical protein
MLVRGRIGTVLYENVRSVPVVQGPDQVRVVHLDLEAIAASAGFMLIDLSNTVAWPHDAANNIYMRGIDFNANPSSAFTGDISLGFLRDVDATNGNFHIWKTWHFDQGSGNIDISYRYQYLHLDEDEIFGPIDANDTLWQTDVNLLGPDGGTTHPSGTGDLTLKITRGAGAVDVGITAFYKTD